MGFASFKATETSLFWWLCCSSFMFECLGFYTILGFSKKRTSTCSIYMETMMSGFLVSV